SVLGDARRIAAMISYCTGLLLPSERKSVEPIAALTAPARTAAQHQSLLHFVGQGDWSDEAVMERIRAQAIPNIEVHGAISAWIIDDTVNKVWRLPCLVLMSWMQAGSPGFVRHP